MDGKMIFNLEDANLPTEGGAWDAMLEHVRQHASYDGIYLRVLVGLEVC
jgi:hypothetical protein